MAFYKTTAQKKERSALLRKALVHITVNLAASKVLDEIINTSFAFEPMPEHEFKHKFLTLTADYMENKNISLAEFNQALSTSLESFLLNEVKDHVMAAPMEPSKPT